MTQSEFSSFSRRTGTRGNSEYFDWCVYLNASESIVNSIESIEYELHPTFPNPNRIVTDENTRFALEGTGWGEFAIGITITYKDGGIDRTEYYLQLEEDGWPMGAEYKGGLGEQEDQV